LRVFASVLLRYNRFFTHLGFCTVRDGAPSQVRLARGGSMMDTHQAYSATRKSCLAEHHLAMISGREQSTHALGSKMSGGTLRPPG
jgi:hypothetical protein